MIDVIIPAYNSHKTIIRTLSSIVIQSIKNDLIVTIVNDGGKDYKTIINFFRPFINICEIGYKDNQGPGFARQYGVDHTNAEFITFVDADDSLLDIYALERMRNAVEEKTQIVLTSFLDIDKSKRPILKEPNSVEVFAHLFKRKFLEDNKIKMLNIRANEDVGYNTMCNLIALHQYGIGAFVALYEPTYIRYYNEQSITHMEDFQKNNFANYIYSLTKAYEFVEHNNIAFEEMAENIVETLYNCYFFYNIALTNQISVFEIEKTSKVLFNKYWNKTKEYFTQQDLEYFYSKIYHTRLSVESFELKYDFKTFKEKIMKGESNEK